jgi:hypothetical protein
MCNQSRNEFLFNYVHIHCITFFFDAGNCRAAMSMCTEDFEFEDAPNSLPNQPKFDTFESSYLNLIELFFSYRNNGKRIGCIW